MTRPVTLEAVRGPDGVWHVPPPPEKPADVNSEEMRRFTVESVARMFAVPPELLRPERSLHRAMRDHERATTDAFLASLYAWSRSR